MKIILLAFITALLLLACGTNNKPVKSILSSENIRSQKFQVDASTDTILVGSRGGLFKILKGTFPSGITSIELKEIYSPIEMLYAGLTTESNGRLLESGGMIYINATQSGKGVNPSSPISVSIPSEYINPSMQLFKGEENAEGDINWIDPMPLDTTPQPVRFSKARSLLANECKNCHSIFRDGTGPALSGVEKRIPDRNLIKHFIWNPARLAMTNEYFRCEHSKRGSIMPAFPILTESEIDDLLDYIRQEELLHPDSTLLVEKAQTGALNDCFKTCGTDTFYVDTANFIVDQNLLAIDDTSSDEISTEPTIMSAESAQSLRKGFTDGVYAPGKYNFQIETLGWFNVDAFVEGLPGTEMVDLEVDTDFSDETELGVHVFFPNKKLLTVGSIHPEDGLFHFEKLNGQIPLYLGDEGIAFAVTSINEKIFYGIQTFAVRKKQTIQMHIKEGTRAQLEAALRRMKLDGIDLDLITKKRIIAPRPCNERMLTDSGYQK
jgi:hypothetical protein